MTSKRILVTGASGFVGRWCASSLVELGHEVFALSRSRSANLPGTMVVKCDLHDRDARQNVLRDVGPDIILHCAWFAEHGTFWNAPENLDWIATSVAFASEAHAVGTRRFVGVGTCVEYRPGPDGICSEKTTPIAPEQAYGLSKHATHLALQALSQCTGLSVAWGRLFLMYGPGEHKDRLVASVARSLVRGEQAELSSGTILRDFLDVRDAGAGLAALVLSDLEGAANIASGQALSVADLARRLGELSGRPNLIAIGAKRDRSGESPALVADVQKVREQIGWSPAISLDEGLGNVLEYWRARA